ncbi:succinate dehydrogenase, hydrophobic membrane anchor protein [Caulobacter sp. 602-2]|uniref:Succinate dehydrogenase hydrophobic membrane anchor subunit n=1 Tax=Caulobacter sp. 602-2 TaxID=2710887 RepID=A0A6G4R208_9CAUL|nr:succinate dehydrogenase, hydrophobic membrane anchor protein [Caulobacter sp. 602-2]NGM51910.1 succinate dehydrogenase, hydrophobic membrane anchor protein [Caulobacter sp. 602-2]
MSTSKSQFRTPLSRARGLGASHHGVGHFIAERVSGLALIPLFLWGAFAGIRLAGADFDTVAAWVAIPINAVLLSLLFIALLVHLKNAIQVVIEDYVEAFAPKAALVIGNLFVCMLAGAAGIVSILKIAFTGAL